MADPKTQFIYLYKVNLKSENNNNYELSQTPEYVFCYSTAQITMNGLFTLNTLSDRENIQSNQVEYYSIHLNPGVNVTCYNISKSVPEINNEFTISANTKDADTIHVFLVPIDNFPSPESTDNDVCTHYLNCYYTYGEIYYNNSIINSTDPIYEFDINNNKCQQLFNNLMMKALSQIQTFQNMYNKYNELVKPPDDGTDNFYTLLDNVNNEILGNKPIDKKAPKTENGNGNGTLANANDKNLSDKIREFSNTINKLFSKKSILSLNWMEPNTMKTKLYELASNLKNKDTTNPFNGLNFYMNIIFLFYVNLSFISKNVPVAENGKSISDDDRRLRLNQIHKDIFDYYAGFNTTDKYFKVKHDTSMFVDHSNYYNQLASNKNDNFEKYTGDMKTTKSIHILDFCNVMSSIKNPDDETKNYNLYDPIMKITLQHLVDNQAMFKAIIDAKLEAPRVGGMISYLKLTNFAETSTTGIANYNERFKIQLNDLSTPTAVLVNYLNDGFSYYSNRTESRQINGANLDILREKYVFGNFDRVFDPKKQNKVIANDMTQVNNELDSGKPVMIIGYGASGSGKTSSLINYYDSNSKKSTDGILIDLCKKYASAYPTFELTVQEIFQTDEPIPDSLNDKSNEKSISDESKGGEGDSIWEVDVETPKNTPGIYQYTIKNEKPFIFQYENEEITLDNTNNNNNQYDIRHRYNRHMFIQGFFKPSNNHDAKDAKGKPYDYGVEPKNITRNGKNVTKYVATRRQTLKEGIQLGEAIRLMVDIDRYTKATTNNPQSSRSHCIVYIKMKKSNSDNSDFKTLIIGDFAGVENTFDDKDYKTAEKMIGIKHQYSTQKYIQQNIGKTDQGSKSQNVSNYLHNFDYDDNNASKYDYMYGGATIAEVGEEVTFDKSYITNYFEITNNKVNNGIYDVNQLNAPYKTIYGDSKSGNTLLSRIVSNNSDNNDNNNNTAPTYSYKYVNKYDEYKNTNYHFSFDDFFNEYVGTDASATRVIRQMLIDVGLSGLDFNNIFPKKNVKVVAQEVSKKGGEGSDDEMTGGVDVPPEFKQFLDNEIKNKSQFISQIENFKTDKRGNYNTYNAYQAYRSPTNSDIGRKNALGNLYSRYQNNKTYTNYLNELEKKKKQSTMFRQQPESPRVSTPSVQNKSPQQSNTQTAQSSPPSKTTIVTSPRQGPQRVPRVPTPSKTTEKYSKIHEYLYSVATVPQEEGTKGLQALLGIQKDGPFHKLLENISTYYNIKNGTYIGQPVINKLNFIKTKLGLTTMKSDKIAETYGKFVANDLNNNLYFKYYTPDIIQSSTSYETLESIIKSENRIGYINNFKKCRLTQQYMNCYQSKTVGSSVELTYIYGPHITDITINDAVNNDAVNKTTVNCLETPIQSCLRNTTPEYVELVTQSIFLLLILMHILKIKKKEKDEKFEYNMKQLLYDILSHTFKKKDEDGVKSDIIFIVECAYSIYYDASLDTTKNQNIENINNLLNDITIIGVPDNFYDAFWSQAVGANPLKKQYAVELYSKLNDKLVAPAKSNGKNLLNYFENMETMIHSINVEGENTKEIQANLSKAKTNALVNNQKILSDSTYKFAHRVFFSYGIHILKQLSNINNTIDNTEFNVFEQTSVTIKDTVLKYFIYKENSRELKKIPIVSEPPNLNDKAIKVAYDTDIIIDGWKIPFDEPKNNDNLSHGDKRRYYLIVVTELFRHLIRIKLAYVLLKDAIKRRNLEGAFINKSLTELANDLKTIFNHKTKRLTNAFPSMIEECIDYYVSPKIYSSVAFDLLKTEPTTGEEPLSVIMKCVNQWLTKSTQSTPSTQSTQSTPPPYLGLTICLFCVLNISRVANDPPPVPYINANKVIRQFNEGIIKESDWNALVQMIKDYQLDNLLIRESTSTSTTKYPPISFNNNNNTFNVATANQELNNQIGRFFDRIHKHNQSSAIGTVDFVDKLVKLNKVKNVCVIDKGDTKFDTLFETPYPDVRAPKK